MKSASMSQKAYAMLMFIAVSVLAGLLLAGLAVPFTALAGGATRMAADSLQYLPAELETPPQSERSVVLMANGEELANFYNENRVYVTLDEIAPIMQDAQIAIEDHRFYEHGAIDLQGLARAFFRTVSGDTQGASTLTQQYVKLVQVEAAIARGDEKAAREATAVNIERKIREMRYAMAIEERLSKDEILERYLNIAYYGGGAYGVEAAAHRYWGISASELSLDQAAMLAGMVQNPVATDPLRNPDRALERRNVVLNRMAELGMISKAEAEEAKAVEWNPETVQSVPNGCVASQFPHLCDYVRLTLISDQMSSLGETTEQRENMLNRGGLIIQTLIDPESQLAGEAAVAQQISPEDPLLAGVAVIQPGTGLIVSMAQSRPERGDFPGTWYNYMVGTDKAGWNGFQAGSTFKVFAIAAALELGMTPGKQYDAPSRLETGDWYWKGCEDELFQLVGEPWRPVNYDRGYGMIDMMRATQNSVNTYFVQMVRDVGVCNTVKMAQRLGVESATGDLVEQYGYSPAFVLGSAEVTPLSVAEAYATFAARGVHCDPIILQSVKTKDGEELPVPDANCEQVLDPEVADGVNHILQSVMTSGTGRPARMADGRPQAGKTGTTNNTEAVWFAGYTPDLAAAAMIAAENGNEYWEGRSNKRITTVQLANGGRLRGTGGGDAGLIWKAAMAAGLEGKPATNFTAPTEKILEGEKVAVPDVSGMSYEEARRTLEAEGFSTVRWGVYSNRRAGTFLGASPSGEATKFSTISLRVSIGPEPEPEPEPTEEPETPAPPAPPGDGAPPGNGGGGGDN